MKDTTPSISFGNALAPERYIFLRQKLAMLRTTIVCSILFSVSVIQASSQARLVLNGAYVNLNQDVYLVIDNPSSNAITYNSGHIISEGENNRIKWNIGTTVGTYIIPWGYGTNYIPLSFTKSAGSGSGHFVFSTYHTTWDNITQLPTGVTNINGSSGTDNSTYVSDRFWQISALSYGTKPSLTDLQFTYLDVENTAPNTIVEGNLRAKRYNSSLNSWTDNLLTNTINTTTNTLNVASVDDANLQSWWMLGTLNSDRYWVASSNSNSNIPANWSETAGGTGNAGVPLLGDAVFFDGSSDFNCTLDADFSASSLTVNTGFSGVITQGPYAITINNDAIFSGGSFIGGSSPLSVNGDLTISGATFTAPSVSIEAKGDFNVTSGSFMHNNGTVVFSGTTGTSQNISSTTATTFNNITITNTTANPGVSVQSNQNLTGILTLTANVNFDADGTGNNAVFKLLSTSDDPTSDAAVAILPSGAQVSGNVTVQRFMSKEGPNSRIYRYISSPVQNATVSDLQQEIPVTGSFTGRSSCSGCVSSSQSLYAYNESMTTDNDGDGLYTEHDGYIDFPDVANTEIFQPGRGYALYVRGNILASTLWDVRGPINTGNVAPVSFPVTYTNAGAPDDDGWNLVGNPFPSTIDWNASSGWTKTNVDGSIYMTDNAGSEILTASWNGVTGTNGGSRYIATGQGFWIKATDTPVLQADENVKAAGTQTAYIREASLTDLLRITMVKGTIRDEAVVHFRDDATRSFDSHADALKLPNSSFNLSTLQDDGKPLAINSVSPLDCKTEIKLNVEDAVAGNYRLNFSEYESFPENVNILLTDNLTGNSVDVRTNSGYDFTVSTSPASYGSARFKVTFQLPALNSELLVSAPTICEGSDATVQIENTQPGVNYSISSGTNVNLNSAIGNGGVVLLTIPASNLNEDTNSFIVQSEWEACSIKVEHPIAVNVSPKYVVTVLDAPKVCSEGTITVHATGAPSGGSYNWYESETAAIPFADQHSDSFTTPVLSRSKTYYVSVVNELGCEGAKTAFLAEVTQVEPAEIHLGDDGAILVSNYKDNNQWYFNSKIIPHASGQSLTPGQSGTYGLEVTVEGCSTTASYDFMIMDAKAPEGVYISVFPNPVAEGLTITIPDSFQQVAEITLINGTGQRVRAVEKITQGDRVFYFDMSNLPAGIYVLRVSASNGIHEQKIIKS